MGEASRALFQMEGIPTPKNGMWDDIAEILAHDGIPCPFHGSLFIPIIVPSWIKINDTIILRFGHSKGAFAAFGIEYRSGNILQVVDVPPNPISFVNSSMQQYIESILWMQRRSPLYYADDPEDDFEMVAAEMGGALTAIDPLCMRENTFWGELYWDVTIGDWAAQDDYREPIDWSAYQDPEPGWHRSPQFAGQARLDDLRLSYQEAEAIFDDELGLSR